MAGRAHIDTKSRVCISLSATGNWQPGNWCGFGTGQWPPERPVPQVSIEFDVADADAVGPAARELELAGYELLHGPRREPWGQTVARLQSLEGASVGIFYTPVLHDED